MTQLEDYRDDIWDQNLKLVGQTLQLPDLVDAARMDRWQAVGDLTQTRSTNRRNGVFAFASIGAIAAAIALFLIWGPGATSPVSAQMIFEKFAQALRGSMAIKLEGIELGTSRISGDIVLERPGSNADPKLDTLFSELHVLLRADNPKWNDLDGLCVLCCSPTTSWTFCRGNGGSSKGDDLVVIPSTYFQKGSDWEEFVDDPLAHFGAMPTYLSFGSGAEGVKYCLLQHQRVFIRRLVKFLLDLSDPTKSPALIEQLSGLSDDRQVAKTDGQSWQLTVTNCGRITALSPPEFSPVDEQEASRGVVWQLRYSPEQKRIAGWSTSGGTSPPGLAIDMEALSNVRLPVDSLEALSDYFKSKGCEITIEQGRPQLGEPLCKIRVKGFPMRWDSRDRDWAVQMWPKLLSGLTLTIHYDGAANRVDRAEFTNLTSASGRIALELNDVHLDPHRLDPSPWEQKTRESGN